MLKRKLRDQSGNALITVILICLVLSIILAGLSSETISNNQVNQANMEADQAYLAARSAIEMLKQIGQDESTVEQIRNARYTNSQLNNGDTDKDVTIELGHMGGAVVKVVEQKIRKQKVDAAGVLKFKADGTPDYEEVVDDNKVLLVSKGYCNGKTYIISRKISLVGEDVPPPDDGNFIFQSKAYTKFGSGDTIIGSGVQGDVLIANLDGKVIMSGAYDNHPVGKLVAAGNLSCDGAGSGTTRCEMIATGGHLDLSTCAHPIVDGDILVGLKKNIGDSSLDPWFKATQLDCRGKLKVEGDIISLKNSRIGENPGDTSAYIPTTVVYCGGNFTTAEDSSTKVNIYGSLVVGGDCTIRACNIYGDVICYGDVNVEFDGNIHGSIYAGGKVNVKENGAFPVIGDIYAGGDLVAVSMNTASKTAAYAAKYDGYGHLITSSSTNSSAFKNTLYNYDTTNAHSSTLKTKLNNEFNSGVDLVGADKYITKELLSTPMPTVRIPTDLASAPRKNINSSLEGPLEITEDCIIVGNDTEYGNWYPQNKVIYINAVSNDIDILVEGNITIKDLGCIVINDGGGAHKVRLFLPQDTSINIKNSGTCVFLPISDAKPNVTLEELLAAGPNEFGSYLDITKIPRFYVLTDYKPAAAGAEDHSPYIRLNATGTIPGYVIAPGMKFEVDSGRASLCGDKDTGTKDGNNNKIYETVTDMSNWSQSGGKIPPIHGLMVCDNLDFGGYVSSAIWYDTRLADETTQRYVEFSKDIADVVFYE